MSDPRQKIAVPPSSPTPARKPAPSVDGPAKQPGEAPKLGDAAAPPLAAPHDFASTPINPGAAQVARTLDRFAFDSDALTSSHLKTIDSWAAEIARRARASDGKIDIVVTGHTDASGEPDYNQTLGQRRADKARAAVEAALRKAGLPASRLGVVAAASVGESHLLVETRDGVKEPRNRAVEISATIAEKPVAPAEAEKPHIDLFKLPPVGVPPLAGPLPNSKIPDVPGPSREWLENYFRHDAILDKLPRNLRDQMISPLKNLDEITANAIIDALPIPADKKAVKAAIDSLLRTLKGRKPKPPEPPPLGPDMGPERQPQTLPGDKMLKSPKIPLPWPFN